MFMSSELARERRVVTNFNRVSRVGIHHPVILHEHAGNTVGCSWNDEGVIEANLQRPGFDLAIPIYIAGTQAQVPLTHDPGLVSGLLEHAWNCQLLPID